MDLPAIFRGDFLSPVSGWRVFRIVVAECVRMRRDRCIPVDSWGRLVAALAIVAIPAIAFRTIPRAELFTTVLFAAVLAIIWRNYRGEPVRLWVLPGVFFLWANLHLGFISGLGLLGAGVFFALCDMLFADRRASALLRLKQLVPWIAASFAATFVNPWGWRLYEAIYRQNKVMQVHSALIGEWTAVHFNSLALRQALNARDPASADWWLLAVAALAILVAIWKKQIGPAVVLAAGMYLAIEHIRLQTLFAILAVVIGGSLLSDLAKRNCGSRKIVFKDRGGNKSVRFPRAPSRRAWRILLSAIFIVLVSVRIADLITDRYYLDAGQITLFGTGPSWWYPERAAAFLKREGLPGNVFHDYGLGRLPHLANRAGISRLRGRPVHSVWQRIIQRAEAAGFAWA